MRPYTVFRSYAAGDRVTYTPALRLWLGLISIQFILAVFTGGPAEAMRASLQANPAALAQYQEIFGENLDAAIEAIGEVMAFLQVPLVGTMTAFSVFALSLFKRGLKFAARLNITFATLTAGSLIGLASQPFVVTRPQYGILAAVLIMIMYGITFARGAPGVLAETRGGAVIKGGLFALIVMALVIVGHTLNNLIAIIYAAASVGGQ
ncbi:MAG: hypothetical protein AAFQ84_00580 [Pseudomonadota bacterium]